MGAPSNSQRSSSGMSPGKLEHVVIIFQENRTPDNLFHGQALINAGADVASSA
jgi:phospholipase C